MALMIPVRLDRVQQVVYEVIGDAVDVIVLWAYSEVPQEELGDGFVALSMINGPTPQIRSGVRGRVLVPAEELTLTVDAATVGTMNVAFLNNHRYRYETMAGDSVTDIRDALLAKIQDGEAYNGTLTAVASGADSITLTSNFLGGLFSLYLFGELSSSGLSLHDQAVYVVSGFSECTINVQCFSKNREPRNGAWALASQCMGALQAPDYAETFELFDVGIASKGVLADISAIAGAHWETRVSFDFDLTTPATFVRPATTIESVTVSMDFQEADGDSVEVGTFTVTAP